MPQSPAFVVERISEGHQPGQLPARLGRAPVLGDAIAGLATRVLADHASSVAVMQRGEPGADTEITRAPWRAGRPAVRRLLEGHAALGPGPCAKWRGGQWALRAVPVAGPAPVVPGDAAAGAIWAATARLSVLAAAPGRARRPEP